MDQALTARHEATHAVVARELGFEFCIATIDPVVVRERFGDASCAVGAVVFPTDLESDLETAPIERKADWVIVEQVGVEFDVRHRGEDWMATIELMDAAGKIATSSTACAILRLRHTAPRLGVGQSEAVGGR